MLDTYVLVKNTKSPGLASDLEIGAHWLYIPCAVVLGRLYTPDCVYDQQTNPEQSNEVDGEEPPHT